MADFQFPNFNVPFPYANLPAQLAASQVPPNQQFSNGSQYGRWNGVNNNAFGLFPSQFQSVFGSPTAPPMQFQPPWGNNGLLGSNQGPGSNPGMANGGVAPPPKIGGGTPAPSGAPSGAPAPFYDNPGSMWGGNGPIQASSLNQNDQMYLNALMHLPGMSGPVSQMIGGSNTDVRNAIDSINATNPAALNGYDFNSYNGPLKQQFASYFAQNGMPNVPGGFQNPITGQYSMQGLPGIFQNYFANNPTQAAQFTSGGTRAIKR